MELADYSPAKSPTIDEQRDALHKGLGRTVAWAKTSILDRDELLRACLEDQRFDAQVEDSRGEWLWRLIENAHAIDAFRVSIFRALGDLGDARSAFQLCELAWHFAMLGDDAFRSRLYGIVEEKPVKDEPSLGEKEILRLDGEHAFLFAAGIRGKRLFAVDWGWDDGYLIDEASERFGDVKVSALLEKSPDESVQRFHQCWLEDKSQRSERNRKNRAARKQVDIRSDQVQTAREVISRAESETNCYWLRRWGMDASEAELTFVLRHILATRDGLAIANLLRVFSNRAMPTFDPRMVDLCHHNDLEVKRRAIVALEKNRHPLIRDFALAQLNTGPRANSIVGLFIENYEKGDEERILNAIELPEDSCTLHWLLMDAIKVLERNSEADCRRLGLLCYALTPCDSCRCDSVRLLHKQVVAPDWLTKECRDDCNEETRRLIAGITSFD